VFPAPSSGVEQPVKLVQNMGARLLMRGAVRGLTPSRFDPSRAHLRKGLQNAGLSSLSATRGSDAKSSIGSDGGRGIAEFRSSICLRALPSGPLARPGQPERGGGGDQAGAAGD
jgi:hypothetical protein